MIASGKARVRNESGERERERERRKQKEQVGTSRTNKIYEDKIEEMSRIIKDLSNKMDRMETEKRTTDMINRN
jgi:hypothetical protein